MNILAARMRAIPGPSSSAASSHRAAAPRCPAIDTTPASSRLLLRPVEAAELLGVSTKTLGRWRIARVRVGGVVGYLRADLLAFLEQNREPTPVRKSLKEEADRVTPSTP
jgi:hypothetical protein